MSQQFFVEGISVNVLRDGSNISFFLKAGSCFS